jgi:hypothetical protein
VRVILVSLLLFLAAPPAVANVDSDLSHELNEMLRIAAQRQPGNDELKQAVEKFSRGSEKGKGGAKDIGLNYLGLPRGMEYSIEGAKVVLDEEPEAIKSLEAAECGWQVQNDQLHSQLCAAILKLAAGVGAHGEDGAAKNAEALTELDRLVGSKEAATVAEMVIEWTQKTRVGGDVFKQRTWDFVTLKSKIDEVERIAAHNDFSVIELQNKLHHISDHTKPKRHSARLVEGAVSAVTMFGPGFGTPIAAQSVGAMWGVVNGGSEESKLLKEVYYQKQLESRRRALRDEAEMALNAYQEAIRTKNTALLVCSEALVAQLVGAIGVPKVLEHPVLNHGTFAEQSMANTTDGL